MVFVRQGGHVPPLQPLYDGPYAVLRRSLHYFTLRIAALATERTRCPTLRLKPCMDPYAPAAQPRVSGCPQVQFVPLQPWEPRREPFSPVLVVLNKLVKTLGKKSNLKFGLI